MAKFVMVLHIHKELTDGMDLKNTCKELISKSDYQKTSVVFSCFVYLKIFNSCHVNAHNVKIHYYPKSKLVLPT